MFFPPKRKRFLIELHAEMPVKLRIAPYWRDVGLFSFFKNENINIYIWGVYRLFFFMFIKDLNVNLLGDVMYLKQGYDFDY